MVLESKNSSAGSKDATKQIIFQLHTTEDEKNEIVAKEEEDQKREYRQTAIKSFADMYEINMFMSESCEGAFDYSDMSELMQKTMLLSFEVFEISESDQESIKDEAWALAEAAYEVNQEYQMIITMTAGLVGDQKYKVCNESYEGAMGPLRQQYGLLERAVKASKPKEKKKRAF